MSYIVPFIDMDSSMSCIVEMLLKIGMIFLSNYPALFGNNTMKVQLYDNIDTTLIHMDPGLGLVLRLGAALLVSIGITLMKGWVCERENKINKSGLFREVLRIENCTGKSNC